MDLSTTYLGFRLPHPFIAGAGPLADSLDNARRLEDAGAAAIVLRSLFEEQINQEAMATHAAQADHAESFAEALSYFAESLEFVIGPHDYLEHIRKTKEAVAVPVIASLCGYTAGGWLDYARQMEQAGADALELNVYYVAVDAGETGGSIEQNVIGMVQQVRRAVQVPIAVKLSPFYTSMADFGKRLEAAGANGLVLFNRFFESDIDTEELRMISRLQLSEPRELLLRLRWLAILFGTLQSTSSLSVTGGVHTAADAIKAVMSGASCVQMVSALLKKGYDYLRQIRGEMATWLEEKEYESLQQMLGSMSLKRIPNPKALSRANYMHLLSTYKWE